MINPAPSPLISVDALRVDRDGCPICERLSLNADGERVVLAGAGAEAIADAITMQATISKGRVLIDGFDVGKREHVGRVGLAPLDPPLPPRMTVLGYVVLSLRTAGFDAKTADMTASASLTDLGLTSLASRRTESLAVPERRAVVLAAAMLPDARTLVAQTPLGGLEGPASQYLLTVLGHLSKRRRVLATAARFDAASAERDLIMGATHVVLVDRNDVLWSGTSAALVKVGPLMSISLRGNTDEFLKALEEEGFTAHGAPPRFTVSRPEVGTADLLSIAERTGSTIVEMVPVVVASPPGTGGLPMPVEPTSPEEPGQEQTP